MTPFTAIPMTTEDGDTITVNVPTSLPSAARAAQYAAAFKRVENPINWKMPIDARVRVVSDEELDIILESVEFYTGTIATETPVSPGTFRITAPGYYAGPAN